MSGTSSIVVGDKGRIVVPASVRARYSWDAGTPLLAIETATGLILVSRDAARSLMREQLAGHDLVADLLRSRRAESADDAA